MQALPHDLLDLVLEHLAKDDITSLCRINRHLNAIASPFLYRELVKDEFNFERDHTVAFRRILKHPEYAMCIRKLSLLLNNDFTFINKLSNQDYTTSNGDNCDHLDDDDEALFTAALNEIISLSKGITHLTLRTRKISPATYYPLCKLLEIPALSHLHISFELLDHFVKSHCDRQQLNLIHSFSSLTVYLETPLKSIDNATLSIQKILKSQLRLYRRRHQMLLYDSSANDRTEDNNYRKLEHFGLKEPFVSSCIFRADSFASFTPILSELRISSLDLSGIRLHDDIIVSLLQETRDSIVRLKLSSINTSRFLLTKISEYLHGIRHLWYKCSFMDDDNNHTDNNYPHGVNNGSVQPLLYDLLDSLANHVLPNALNIESLAIGYTTDMNMSFGDTSNSNNYILPASFFQDIFNSSTLACHNLRRIWLGGITIPVESLYALASRATHLCEIDLDRIYPLNPIDYDNKNALISILGAFSHLVRLRIRECNNFDWFNLDSFLKQNLDYIPPNFQQLCVRNFFFDISKDGSIRKTSSLQGWLLEIQEF